MANFLISVDFEPATERYMASFFNGQTIQMQANTYHDAVLEADMIEPEDYEVGYN